MQALLVTIALAGSGGLAGEPGASDWQRSADLLSPTLQTGSLLFSSGDCLAIRVYTASLYTHVAAVVVGPDDSRVVYDSMNGAGVRRLSLAEYLSVQAPQRLEVHHPSRAFSAEQEARFAESLETQLGRPYAILHHISGERSVGLHCAEYVTDALMAIDVVRAKQPARVSPASLRTGITQHRIYSGGEVFELAVAATSPAVAEGQGHCARLWLDTCECCSRCCRKLQGWILCR